MDWIYLFMRSYKMSEYKIISKNTVKRLVDNAFIPFEEANTDYQEYIKWLEEGNIPDPPDDVDLP